MRGKFFTFEGIDGSGKSTLSRAAAEYLEEESIPYVCTGEPGGTRLGDEIRDILLKVSQTEDDLSSFTELCLFFAVRSVHVKDVIQPALAEGKHVICDRFTDSTFAYQQAGATGVNASLIQNLADACHRDFWPDRTYFLDADVQICMSRLKAADRFEQKGKRYFEEVRSIFRERTVSEPQRFQVIDASMPLEETKARMLEDLKAQIGRA